MALAELIIRVIDWFYIRPVAAVLPRQVFRYVAFRRSPIGAGTQLLRYLLSVAGSVLLTYAGLKFFVEVCGVWPTPAKMVTTLLTTVYSFLAAKYFTFRHAEKPE